MKNDVNWPYELKETEFDKMVFNNLAFFWFVLILSLMIFLHTSIINKTLKGYKPNSCSTLMKKVIQHFGLKIEDLIKKLLVILVFCDLFWIRSKNVFFIRW